MRNGRGAGASSRTRKSDGKSGRAPSRRPGYRLNPVRQAFFVLMALAGIAIGYGFGYLFKETPPPVLAGGQSPPLLPEDANGTREPVRAYEEALPPDIIEDQGLAAQIAGGEEAERRTPGRATERRKPEAAATGANASPEPLPKPTAEPAPMGTDPVPGPEVAALPAVTRKIPATAPPPAAAPATGELPAWRRFAVRVPEAQGRPRIVIVIDDLGIDKPRSARAIRMPGPLTLSFLTYASGLEKQTAAARAAGHELLMHIPMEPGSPDVDPGPNVLLTGIPTRELQASLEWNLEQFSGYVGVNNHMGSRFTTDLTGMMVVMKELKKRNLLFLDSITAGNSAAGRAARRTGVPFAARNVFLDHEDDVKTIKGRLIEVERLARRTGVAIAIGHPREATLRALAPWLEGIVAKGFQLVPLSAVVKFPPSRG